MVRITNEDNFEGDHFSFHILKDCIDFSISSRFFESTSQCAVQLATCSSTSAKTFFSENLIAKL